jgi:putative phage-type endonuclease
MICDLQQNTPEWLAFRRYKIGASDAPIIMNESPWTTPFQLWERKLNLVQEKEQSPAMKRGSELESLALKTFNEEMGLSLEPKVILSKQHDWAMASLDGYDESRYAVEIKCPNSEDHATAMKGKVPEKYFPQLQHQMFVANLPHMWYYSFDGKKGILVWLESNTEYQCKMLEKEFEFYKCMKEFVPPTMNAKDFLKRSDLEWRDLSQRYLSVKGRLTQLESEEKYLKDALVKASGGQNCIGEGLRISKTVRRGSVDYKLIPELNGVDLEEFRSDPIVSWRVTETKEIL